MEVDTTRSHEVMTVVNHICLAHLPVLIETQIFGASASVIV